MYQALYQPLEIQKREEKQYHCPNVMCNPVQNTENVAHNNKVCDRGGHCDMRAQRCVTRPKLVSFCRKKVICKLISEERMGLNCETEGKQRKKRTDMIE